MSYYHAKIFRNDKLIAKLPGKYNTKEVLDAWLVENWPGPLGWQSVHPWQVELLLKITVTNGATPRVVTIARMPEPKKEE